MPAIKYSVADQFLHENLTWERELDFYRQENAFLKTRLSKVLDNNMDKNFLALAEQFQSNFILKDEHMKLLREDIKTLQKKLMNCLEGMVSDDKKIMQQQQKLHDEMDFFEKNFASLKNEFNQYLASIV
ncbi:hypothetical protein BH11BAC3_BH11BAC3_31300 [soil metagenome]